MPRQPDHPALALDYWVPQVTIQKTEHEVDGVSVTLTEAVTIYHPYGPAQSLRMLAHFRALDSDEDEETISWPDAFESWLP